MGKVSLFTKLVEMICVKNTCNKKGLKVLTHYAKYCRKNDNCYHMYQIFEKGSLRNKMVAF